jgi:pimeloyl-ACP methyl ester carboxylesterase
MAHDCLDRLDAIRTPTLVVAGANDIFTPLALSRAIHDRIAGAELAVWPDTGHAVHWEVLEEFNARSRDFMLAHE